MERCRSISVDSRSSATHTCMCSESYDNSLLARELQPFFALENSMRGLWCPLISIIQLCRRTTGIVSSHSEFGVLHSLPAVINLRSAGEIRNLLIFRIPQLLAVVKPISHRYMPQVQAGPGDARNAWIANGLSACLPTRHRQLVGAFQHSPQIYCRAHWTLVIRFRRCMEGHASREEANGKAVAAAYYLLYY